MTEQQKIVEYLVAGKESERWFWEQAVQDVLDAQKAVIKEDLARAIAARAKANGGYSKAAH